jgi:PAS domain S-box-containing protein
VLLLSGAHARYRQLVEDMQQGALTVSESGEILFANHSFAAMLGAQPIDLLRTRLQDRARPDDQAAIAGLLAPRAGQPDVDVMLERDDGGTLSARLAFVSAGEGFITLLVTDLSKQAQLDEAADTIAAIRKGCVDGFVVDDRSVALLECPERPYRLLVDHMRQGALTVTAAGEICYVNERFASMLGLAADRLIGTPLADLVMERDRAELGSILSAAEAAQGELVLRGPGGSRIPTLATMARQDTHRMFLFSDLTERKRYLASDERTRGFLSILAEEFRAMLAQVSDSASALNGLGLPREARAPLEVIERQTARMRALADDLATINPKD